LVGNWGDEAVDHNDTFDHVAKHRNKRTVAKSYCHHPAMFSPANRAVNANYSWRTAKARCIEPKALRFGIQ
jgi:hypothetical protein